MTDFLLKRFVKDYKNVKEASVRTRYGILSSAVGIFCNVLLFTVKLCVGVVINSVSVMSDAFNNLSDAASSIISFVGVKMAEKPADADHPFGHGRIEYITTLIVAFLIMEVGLTFLKSSVGKIMEPESIIFSYLSILILLLSIGVKFWLSRFNQKLGKMVESSVMKATAADAMGDVITTSATIVSVLIFHFFHWNLDGIIGLGVSAVVIYSGFSIAKETVEPLIGEAIDPNEYERIMKFVIQYDGIEGCHDLIVHNYGPNRSMATIHAEVPSDADIEEAHELVDRIERDAMRELGVFLVIHMDPISVSDKKVCYFRQLLEEVLKEEDIDASYHDFRIAYGKERVNLIFDLVMSRRLTKAEEEALIKRVSEAIKEKDRRCVCVINLEYSFVAGK